MRIQAKGTAGEPRGRKPYWDEDTAECLLAVRKNNEVVCDHITIHAGGAKVMQNKVMWRARIASMCQQMGKPMVKVQWTEADEEGRITPVISR